MEDKNWTVRIHITEDGDDTRAEAVLTTQDTSQDTPEGGTPAVTGRGVAHRNPIDRPIAEIGDELAASRALEDLAIRLHDIASDDIVQLAGPADQGGGGRAWETP
ncbi:dsRBD fold-containing protein [Streptomyces sp. NPDC093591]|uniref:dsRBD fold-containing protein n=1 Tax=Streptomyces sp. NPDC093591 TaxID=3366044 RepID=UPI00382700DA